ncbi:MAG: aspartate carbamoyltransferase catalytic subunit [Rhodobacteraceae bacterium]|nr:aspartate carbamoyltransferase catalytic subunit [Paracoccaceae bacterium]
MTTRLDIPAHERGYVRVFALDLPDEEAARFNAEALATALGARHFDATRAEVFPVGDLGELGLSGYLAEGMGVAAEELDPDRARLDALKGHVAVVPSVAFAGKAQAVTVTAPLRLIGTYREESAAAPDLAPLMTESAEGLLTGTPPQPPSPAPRGNNSALIGLAIAVIVVLTVLVLKFGAM